MNISVENLNLAVDRKIITQDQADELVILFKNHRTAEPRFDASNVLYYMGGLVAIGAMTLFMGLGWENFGGWGIFFISLIYAVIGLLLSRIFKDRGYPVPAGVCATFVVALTPLAIYGFQQALGWWPADGLTYQHYHQYIRWHWIYLELGTLMVGAIMAYIYRYPFLLMPIAVTLWYMSMDIASMMTGTRHNAELMADVSVWFGLAILVLAFWVDLRSRKSADYAFWLFISGIAAFWGGLTAQYSDNELSKFIYFCINVMLIGCGVVLVRRVFVIFGAFGCSFYLGYLAFKVFKDSWFFPISLTAIGLGVMFLGVLWQKNENQITLKVRKFLPKTLEEFIKSREIR